MSSPEDKYLSFDFCVGYDEPLDEDAVERIADAFLEAVEAEGMFAAGGIGPPPPEDRICSKCEGIGIADPIPDERKCPTCDGSGEVDPDGMSKEEWNEVYAPVAQGTERPAPTREDAGSNPAGGTKC